MLENLIARRAQTLILGVCMMSSTIGLLPWRQCAAASSHHKAHSRNLKSAAASHKVTTLKADKPVVSMDTSMERIDGLMDDRKWSEAASTISAALKSETDAKKKCVLLLKRSYADLALGNEQAAIDDSTAAMSDETLKPRALCLLGMAYRTHGEYKKAVATFDDAVKADPNLSLAYYGRGLSHEYLDEHEAAIADFTESIKLQPDKQAAQDSYVLRARAYMGIKDYAKAIEDCDHAIDIDWHFAKPYETRAQAFYETGNHELALIDAMMATELAPHSDTAWCIRGITALELGRVNEALACLNSAIEMDPKFAMAYAYRALTWVGLEEYDRAIQDADMAFAITPNDPVALRARCIAEKRLGHDDKALVDLDEMVKLDPKIVKLYVLRADCCLALGNYERALVECSEAEKLDPNLNLWAERSRALHAAGKKDEALALCSEQLTKDPNNADAYFARATMYMERNQPQQAIDDANRAIEHDKSIEIGARELQALAYGRLQRYNDEITACDAILKLDKKNSTALRHKAAAYSNMKQFDRAFAAMDEAVRIEPSAQNYASRADMHIDEHNPKQAIADADKAIEMDGKFPYPFFVRGAAYGMLGENDKREADFNQAVKLETDPSAAQDSLGYYYKTLGLNDRALEAYTKALELQNGNPCIYHDRGEVEVVMGKYAEANADFAKAVSLAPAYASAWSARAVVDNKLGQFQQAVEDANNAIGHDPSLADAYSQRATAYEKLGKAAEAQADKAKADELSKH